MRTIETKTAIWRRQPIASRFTGGIAIALLAFAAVFIAPELRADPPLPGAIFTTGFDGTNCSGVNLNIYGAKGDAYLNGGPAHPGAASLPDGDYYVQVTDPSGACDLGTSVGTGDEKPFKVSKNGATIAYTALRCAHKRSRVPARPTVLTPAAAITIRLTPAENTRSG